MSSGRVHRVLCALWTGGSEPHSSNSDCPKAQDVWSWGCGLGSPCHYTACRCYEPDCAGWTWPRTDRHDGVASRDPQVASGLKEIHSVSGIPGSDPLLLPLERCSVCPASCALFLPGDGGAVAPCAQSNVGRGHERESKLLLYSPSLCIHPGDRHNLALHVLRKAI